MADQLWQDPLTQWSSDVMQPSQRLTGACTSAWQRQKWHLEQERQWEGHLRDLQQCICELLIKNQQLRGSLMSPTNQRREFADE